jgi:ABC-type sugar transport system ATPase subunit
VLLFYSLEILDGDVRMGQDLCLEMKGIDKRFPGVHALKNVDFSLEYGEIHGLLGENGAGKSTLMKTLGGVELMDCGEVHICGQKASIGSPLDAQKLGVSFIHQELSLFLHLDIATNIHIQDLPRVRGFIRKKELNGHSPGKLVKYLQMGERQLIEIARCLTMDTKILVLDEPTSSLTKKEVEKLFGLMRKLREKGISIIFISHRLDEVFDICDRITVMRDGEKIQTKKVKETSTSEIVTLMIGRQLSEMFKRERMPLGKELMAIKNFCRGERFQDINFTVHQGEIVGLYGLMGSGRSEIVRSIFGLESFESGEVYMEEKKVSINQPLDAIEHGIGLITENRREEGLMIQQTVQFNLVVANLTAYVRKHQGQRLKAQHQNVQPA